MRNSATRIARLALAVVAAVAVFTVGPTSARAFDACTGKLVCLHLLVGWAEPADDGLPDGLITSDPPGINCRVIQDAQAPGSTCDAYFTSSTRTSFDVVLKATASPGHAVYERCAVGGVPSASCTRTVVADCLCARPVVVGFIKAASVSTAAPKATTIPAATRAVQSPAAPPTRTAAAAQSAAHGASGRPSPPEIADAGASAAAPTDLMPIVLAILAAGVVVGLGLLFVGLQMRRGRRGG